MKCCNLGAMAFYWIFIAFSWFGFASLQYINTAGADAETLMDPLDSTIHYPPLPYVNYFNVLTPRNNMETLQNNGNMDHSQFTEQDLESLDSKRMRRTTDEDKDAKERNWQPNLIDSDKTIYLPSDTFGIRTPFIVQAYSDTSSEKNTTDISNSLEKRSFSPWGGKRNRPNTIEQMWTWKKSAGIREPSMPKRVRFSPWGGKRSGQMIYKPGTKGSKVIFSASVPELTRIVSNYSPNGNRLNMAGLQFIPSPDKRHPIKILALNTKLDERTLRDALPFNTFMETIPKMYKPGHAYLDVHLKKDGKRKVKFSAWGGKRSPPIIGPIWTPASQDIKESTLDTIVLIRNNQNEDSEKML
nr:uncharacterized protein LOC116773905 isoform X2 [Danaus plexippus plexippus]